jgi:hypothetical protein
MKISITDKIKKDIFIALFHIIKINTSTILCIVSGEKLYIQGMDKSHICLFEISINKEWFNEFQEIDEEEFISFDTQMFYSIINNVSESQTITIYTNTSKNDNINDNINDNDINDNDNDHIYIDLTANEYKKKDEFNKHFKLTLVENDYEVMNIPKTEYNCDILISSKKICDITGQMINFGDDLSVKLSENDITFSTHSTTGEMNVKINIDELDELSMDEGIEGHIFVYNIHYIAKMCLTNKLSNKIYLHLNKELPMKINYDLGEYCNASFYIAPKLEG